ncbi:hypothetical protein HNP84_007341 [Thermocatellispora tengchongensis]|uniref:Uncharacterized protein n=2 Tax=Thermocatellispora tengchongensis TaxID=1073253 RepID=A0A840PF31_9ACTN|nr:hypothetical protein [Thermocatellispora tengchongensis]MBB5137589.1 hypothetical protein [Thermocatellispora tengchongensis]
MDEDLEMAITRQERLGAGTGGRPGRETPIPFGVAASEVAWALRTTLVSWVLVMLDEEQPRPRGATCGRTGCGHPSCGWIRNPRRPPEETLPAMAEWLASRAEAIRRHPHGAAGVDEILDAIRRAQAVTTRGADLLYCGPCGAWTMQGECEMHLYARAGAGRVQCRCGAIWDVAQRRDRLLRAAWRTLASATEIARALTSLDHPITPERIWQWAHRGRLTVRGYRREGRRLIPLYRVGEVMTLLEGLDELHGPACRHRCRHDTCRLIRARRARSGRAA